ncbi:tyrosine-type recombinase/integrase [Frankia sp. Cj3]|uniref:tyrosine-type recombinase/integrase n=1 Tax=Frankia sp. Cj3 TaxID=2880976 RepID=UPI001EF53B13|nr:tyrosine-type recombinase/integrase [Frankia sp. Cj3]
MSTLPPVRQALADYLALRRTLGYELRAAGRILGQFVDYLDAHGAQTPTIDHALAWANLPDGASTAWRAIRLSAVRGFAAYLHGLDPTIAVPPADLIRHGPDRATPYLYSDREIGELIIVAGDLRPRLRAATYQTLIGLLAAGGLRVGEAIALDTSDLDGERDLLTIRATKFGKSRLVPLHPTAIGALGDYIHLRDQTRPRPICPALLVSTAGTRLRHANIGLTFNRLTRQAGIIRRSATCRPRPHDLRHSFAVASVLDWYRTGVDVEAMMPYLSTYLGHTDPKHTYWYLSAAPELMALAGQRLHLHLKGRS